MADRLLPHGLQAAVYHAGLGHDVREHVQMDFMKSDKGIVCATIAFGMGIDKGARLPYLYWFCADSNP